MSSTARLTPSFQGLIVGDPKGPGAEIAARTPELQVPEECKKHFLDDVLSILDWQPEADHVT
ncbi:MAG TPA: hypothetical protein VMT15_18170 [Bryobacteraceae bacterium]|nr:hypothetical protein [Bryobacteraceae bacterium]